MKDGGPAFPTRGKITPAHSVQLEGRPETRTQFPPAIQLEGGMSLRDYFAAVAIPGIIAHDGAYTAIKRAAIAEEAYLVADAMLKVREEKS